MSLLWWIVIACVVAALGFAFAAYYPEQGLCAGKKTAAPKPESVSEIGEKFGHKFYPMSEVRSGVHKPPLGHFWELGVTHDEDGGRWLVLRCVQFESSVAVDEKRVSLDVCEEGGKPWSAAYSDEWNHHVEWSLGMSGRSPTGVRDKAREQIVRGLTEWSRKTFLKHSTDPGALVDSVVIA